MDTFHRNSRLANRLQRALPYIILTIACIAFCWLFVLQYGIFGSKIDWINQHSVIPDYFRKRFYETGNLFPDYAWNIGGGQNIYHLSYYGLFSPVILFSFALPFIRMDYYIMGSSILSYIISVLLFYRFLRCKKITGTARFGTALLFALAASMVYQSYNQLMFINYMPFLCLSLIGTDLYLKKQKKGCLLLGTVGMILTSFYFSIGGMLALCLYALSEYFLITEQVSFISVLKKGLCYTGILLQGVLLCGILLVPAAVSIFSSRQENAAKEQLSSIISFAPLKILYTPYGMGLTVLAVVAILSGIFCAAKWQERILPSALAILLSVPAIGFLLNGGLYDKQKVFIPFVPLVCLQCGRYISIKHQRLFSGLLPWALTGTLIYLSAKVPDFEAYIPIAWADFSIALLCYVLSFLAAEIRKRINKPEQSSLSGQENTIYMVPILLAACISLFAFDMQMNPERERMVPTEEYKNVVDIQKNNALKNILERDNSFYRMEVVSDGMTNHNNVNRLADIRQNITSMYSSCYNKEYWSFRKDTYALNEPFRNNMMQSATDNPCFLQFMGVKYLLHQGNAAGYKPTGENNILTNPSAAPILYVTNQVISEKQYKMHAFPTNQTALLQYAVVPDGEASESTNAALDIQQMEECDIEIPECKTPELTIKKTSDGYEVTAKEDSKTEIIINGVAHKETNLFALIFDVDNKKPDSDMHIRVNEQTNRLTAISHEYANQNTNFTFMISKETGQNNISIEFSAGSYRIANIKAFVGNLKSFQNLSLYQNPVDIERGQKLDNSIAGNVTAEETGYLITSFPYDENFKIYLDGKEIDSLKVNTAFMGAKIPAGKHMVQLIYHAPGKKAGLMLTLAGIVTLIAVSALQNIFRKRKYQV